MRWRVMRHTLIYRRPVFFLFLFFPLRNTRKFDCFVCVLCGATAVANAITSESMRLRGNETKGGRASRLAAATDVVIRTTVISFVLLFFPPFLPPSLLFLSFLLSSFACRLCSS